MLNQRIRGLRQARNMSQVELANRLGVTKQSVSNWENDNIQPSIEMLMRLASVFSVSTDYILGIEQREYLDVSGLSKEVIAHIRQICGPYETTGFKGLKLPSRLKNAFSAGKTAAPFP